MAMDYTEFHTGRQPSVLPKSLLVLILLEIIVLILLFLVLPRIYGGTLTIGDGVMTGYGGGITVSASCGERCRECPECKECTDCPTCTCEEYCRQAFGKDKTKYDICVKERCAPETCEDTCRTRYGSNKDAYALCLKYDCNPGDPCETSCWKKSQGSPTVYQACIQRECTTCEETCKTRYSSNKDAYALCLRLDCARGDPCETACWKKSQGSPTAYQACIQRDCASCEENCVAKYGNNKDAIAICLNVDCGKPTDCERECWQSSDGSATTYQYCVQKMCERQPTTPVTVYTGGGDTTRPDTTRTGTTTCRENDKGRDAQHKGTTTITTHYTDGTQDSTTYTDSCANTREVLEYYCQGNNLASENIACPYGCDNGECRVPTTAAQPSTFTPIIVNPQLTVPTTVLKTLTLQK
jgi:hypothetical protein